MPNPLAYKRPRTAIAICMSVVIVVPILCGLIFYSRANRTVLSQQENIIARSMELMVKKLDADMDKISEASIRLKRDLRLVAMPDISRMTAKDRLAFYDARKVMADILADADSFIAEIYLLRPGTGYILSSGAYNEIRYLPESFGSLQYGSLPEGWTDIVISSDRSLIPVAGHLFYKVKLSAKTSEEYRDRLAILALSDKYFDDITKYYGMDGAKYSILDAAGNMIAQQETTEEKYFVRELAFRGYTLRACIPASGFTGVSDRLSLYYLALLLAAITIGAVLILVLSRSTAMPIRELLEYVNERCDTGNTEDIEDLTLIRTGIDRLLDEQRRQAQELDIYARKERMRELEDAIAGNTDIRIEHPYMIACFFGQPRAKDLLADISLGGFHTRSISLGERQVLFLEDPSSEAGLDKMASAVEAVLQTLDDASIPGCRCGISLMHAKADELETAWNEALITADCMQSRDNIDFMRFDAIRFSPEYFLRDWHHLDKQLQFSKYVTSHDHGEALKILPDLFPEEYLSGIYPTIARLHLDSLKFQFLHDMDTLCQDSPDSDELSRTFAREILTSKNHQALFELMEGYLRDMQYTPVRAEKPLLANIKTYIKENYTDQQLNVTAVAGHFGLTIDRLSKLFTQEAGMGVLQYIHKVRVESACRMLLSEKTGINEIAARVGYSSPLTFTRAFKARYNMTPGEYRKIHPDNG